MVEDKKRRKLECEKIEKGKRRNEKDQIVKLEYPQEYHDAVKCFHSIAGVSNMRPARCICAALEQGRIKALVGPRHFHDICGAKIFFEGLFLSFWPS